MPYGKSYAPGAFAQASMSPQANMQRDSITSALMGIRNPPGGLPGGGLPMPGQEPGWEAPMPPPQVGPTNPGMQPPIGGGLPPGGYTLPQQMSQMGPMKRPMMPGGGMPPQPQPDVQQLTPPPIMYGR